jgi:hypothetical protein
MGVFLVIWLLLIKSVESNIYGSITIFLWGLSIIFEYLSKDAILISALLEIPAGEYQKPERLLGLVAGIAFCFLAVHIYF